MQKRKLMRHWKSKKSRAYILERTLQKQIYGKSKCKIVRWNDRKQRWKAWTQFVLLNQLPKSIISYDRQYFCSFDGKVRITIDQNLQSFLQNFPFFPNLIRSKKHYNFMIIEVKFDSKDEHLVEMVRQEIPFAPRRFSKYFESVSINCLKLP